MPLEKFPLLEDNTRLIRFKDTLYKVKVKYRHDTFLDGVVTFNQSEAHYEVEQTFRAVLYMCERNQTLKTIATQHFLIQPLKIPWSFPRKCSDYSFQQNGKVLKVFDFMFEFCISNRESEKGVSKTSVSKCQSLNTYRSSDEESKDNKLKQAVVVVKDISSEATTRFGRTEDGQLYRVCPNRKASAPKNSSARKDDSSEDDGVAGDRKSSKKARHSEEEDMEKKLKLLKRQDNPGLLKNNNKGLRTKNMKDLMPERKEHSKQHTLRQEKGESSHLSSRDETETTKKKLLTPRDKFSLRLSELRELKRENVQEQKLRDRKVKLLAYKTPRTQIPEIKDTAYKAESKHIENIKELNESMDFQSPKAVHANIKHKKDLIKRKKFHQTSALNVSEEQRGTNRSVESKVNKVAHVETLTDRRKVRKKSRSSRLVLGSSSQSELETEDQSAESDIEKNNNRHDIVAENRRGNQKIMTNTSNKLIKSLNTHKIKRTNEMLDSGEEQAETRGRSPRRSQRLNKTVKQQDSSVTETESDISEAETGNISMEESETHVSPRRKGKTGMKRKSGTFEMTDGDVSRKSQSSIERSESSQSDDENEAKMHPRKSQRLEKKRELESSTGSEEETMSAGASEDSARSRKVKLYASRHSPQVVREFASKPVTEISSPRVSTVLPVKRSSTSSDTGRGQRSQPGVISPRITRQSLHDEELRRIQGLREERPTQVYRDIMLAQGRDRYMVEQAENAETDKLQQLYQPTVPNQIQGERKQAAKRRRSSGIWGKIMDTLVTPTKKYMLGKKK